MASERNLRALKAAARREARARRDAIAGAPVDGSVARAASRVFRDILPAADVVVAGFWPMGSEIDCRPILEGLHASGYRCCLPVVTHARAPLVFRCWRPGMRLARGMYGEQIPPPDADIAHPDVLLVPGLAFDREGYRIGYGAGFYDRTLAALRAERSIIAAGLAYAGQLVPRVPREPEDQPLDWIATDHETIACSAVMSELDEPHSSAL